MHQSVDGNIQEVPDLEVYGAQCFHIVLPESAGVHHPHLGRGRVGNVEWERVSGDGGWAGHRLTLVQYRSLNNPPHCLYILTHASISAFRKFSTASHV